jgi:hypothetical protein
MGKMSWSLTTNVEGETSQTIAVEHLKGKDHLGDLDVDGKC